MAGLSDSLRLGFHRSMKSAQRLRFVLQVAQVCNFSSSKLSSTNKTAIDHDG
jgi:hypothetical protein